MSNSFLLLLIYGRNFLRCSMVVISGRPKIKNYRGDGELCNINLIQQSGFAEAAEWLSTTAQKNEISHEGFLQ